MKKKIEDNKRTANPLIIIVVTLAFVVTAYFIYDHFRSTCGEIFEQTTLNVRTKAQIIKTRGELFVGREKIQELTSSSQKVGQHLKTCCTVLQSGKLNPDQFQRCIDSAQNYEKQLTKVIASLDEAQTAKQQNQPNVVKTKVEQINRDLNVAKAASTELEAQIKDAAKTGVAKQRWEVIPNPKLKSLGRIVVSLSEGVHVHVKILDSGGKDLTGWFGSGSSDLLPGQYRVDLFGASVPAVPVASGMDTRVRAGVFNIATDSHWTIYDETGSIEITSGFNSQKLALPEGNYRVEVTGKSAPFIISDGQVTDF